MKIEEIIDVIKQLSRSQGFYTRLYNQIMEMSEEEYEIIKKELEKKKNSDAVELVMYLEGGE